MSQQVVFCHSCQRRDVVHTASWTGSCQYCTSGFTEVLGHRSSNSPGARPRVRVIRNFQGDGDGGGAPRPGGPQGGQGLVQLLSGLVADYGDMGDRMLFDGASEEDFVSMIATRIMDEYQPRQTPTAARIRESLPMYAARPAGAKGEPDPTEACCCAGEPCAVCHEEFEEGLKVAELPCSHCFHGDCLMPWLEAHNTCPVCRIELPQEGS